MKAIGKPRAGMTLALGILVGLGLVILPGLLTPPTVNSAQPATNSTSTNSGVTTSIYTGSTGGSGSRGNQPATAPVISAEGSLVVIVGLVLFPAIAVSILVRHLTLKSARGRSEREDR